MPIIGPRWLWVLVIAWLLAGCSGSGMRPYSYEPATEIPPGPGLFSGPDGVFGTAPRAD